MFKQFDNVNISESEYAKLVDKFGASGADERIENLSFQKYAHNYKYASDYRAVLAWDRRDQKRRVGHEPEAAPPHTGKHSHYCDWCETPHNWNCGGLDMDGWPCTSGVRCGCPVFIRIFIERRDRARMSANSNG